MFVFKMTDFPCPFWAHINLGTKTFYEKSHWVTKASGAEVRGGRRQALAYLKPNKSSTKISCTWKLQNHHSSVVGWRLENRFATEPPPSRQWLQFQRDLIYWSCFIRLKPKQGFGLGIFYDSNLDEYSFIKLQWLMIRQVKKPSLILHREKALGWLVYFHDRSDLVSHVMSLC